MIVRLEVAHPRKGRAAPRRRTLAGGKNALARMPWEERPSTNAGKKCPCREKI